MAEGRLLIAHLSGAEETEAEPVVVDVDGTVVTLTLDSGLRVTFDYAELLSALLAEERIAA